MAGRWGAPVSRAPLVSTPLQVVVVSPPIALMVYQVQSLRHEGVKAKANPGGGGGQRRQFPPPPFEKEGVSLISYDLQLCTESQHY